MSKLVVILLSSIISFTGVVQEWKRDLKPYTETELLRTVNEKAYNEALEASSYTKAPRFHPLTLLALSFIEYPGYTKHGLLWSSAYPMSRIEDADNFDSTEITEDSKYDNGVLSSDGFGSKGPLQFLESTTRGLVKLHNKSKPDGYPEITTDRINWFNNCMLAVAYSNNAWKGKTSGVVWDLYSDLEINYLYIANHNSNKGFYGSKTDTTFRAVARLLASDEIQERIKTLAREAINNDKSYYLPTPLVKKLIPELEYNVYKTGIKDYDNITIPHMVKGAVAREALSILYHRYTKVFSEGDFR